MVLPAEVLQRTVGKKIRVMLKDDRIWVATLVGYDEHMNMVLDDAEAEPGTAQARKLGRVVLRGSNVVGIGLPES